MMRIGQGYDVHAFGDGDHVVIGGVRIAHPRGLVAHSDGDVAVHALCDAILGALALGDIGKHFPPSDAQWRNADGGKCLPMSPSASAPRMASHNAWIATSPSECATSPRGCAMRTPPMTTWSPSPNA